MRGFTAGGTTEYRTASSRSRGGEGYGMGLQVGKNTSDYKQGDHSQVREARGKGFVLSLLRGDPQHSPDDLHIGQHNENKTIEVHKDTNHKYPNFPEEGVQAGELEDVGNFTEELVHSIALAEWY